ncbi:MAG: xanthine dehydrogenase family protein molybdopterin-binding subunit [Proteobacteria bacterium]|nr:xanthine dehydrogenase family protein molybdopterin-binding subunit [Burkholderiales bacterium]
MHDSGRRRFMTGTAGLTFGIASGTLGGMSGSNGIAHAQPRSRETGRVPPAVTMNPWVTLATDGTVTIMSPACEMGQGSLTSLPLILADEMDVEWAKVRIVHAPPNDALYGNPRLGGVMYTAGSLAVTGYFTMMRQFGAQVRWVLVDNAARHLGVPVDALTTQPGRVLHVASGRSLGYGEIAEFAVIPARAPEIPLEPLDKVRFRLIGRDVGRIDVPDKVRGAPVYSIDVQRPGMVYGAILREPVEGAAPLKIDDRAARAIEGVLDVVRLKYGVGVVADAPWAAFKAKQALQVEWERKATGWGFSNDKGFESFAAIARDPSRQGVAWEQEGNARSALQKATNVFEREYRADYAYHAQMEPLNSVADVSPKGDACEIWCGTQSQTFAVAAVADALGIPVANVKLNDMMIGGAFGRRGNRDTEFIVDAALLSRAVGKPVKVMWTREDDVKNGRFRPLYVNRLRAGLDANGRITAMHHKVVCDRVLPFADPVRAKAAKGRDNIAMRGTEIPSYDIADRLSEGIHPDTGIRTAPLRAIGVGQNCFANECFIDEIAAERKLDPVAYRVAMLAKQPRAQHVVREVARMARWEQRARLQEQGRALGVAYIDYTGSHVAAIAEISVDRASGEVKVHRFWCTIDCGVAVQPDNVVAQTESSIVYGLGLALTEQITIADGRVVQANFYDYRVPRMSDMPELIIKVIPTPNHPTGAGQMATPLVAPAISNAFAQLTGVRLRQQPMLAERVRTALRS